MVQKIYILLVALIAGFPLHAMHKDADLIKKHQFESPVKNSDLIDMYTQYHWRGVIQNPIPATAAELSADLTRKSKARIQNLRYRYVNSNGTLVKQLNQIYSALPQGYSPQKVRKTQYTKPDRVIVRQALSAAAAVAQLNEDKALQEQINPRVRKLRLDIEKYPQMLNPVPRPINELLAKQKERADAVAAQQKAEQENEQPSQAAAQESALNAAASSSSSSSSSSASKGTKRKRQETNIFNEDWQREQRQKTNAKLQQDPTVLTDKKNSSREG